MYDDVQSQCVVLVCVLIVFLQSAENAVEQCTKMSTVTTVAGFHRADEKDECQNGAFGFVEPSIGKPARRPQGMRRKRDSVPKNGGSFP